MATLVTRINDLAVSIRNKLNLMSPRLVPAGGASGSFLVKSSASDYATAWATVAANFTPIVTTGSGAATMTVALPVAGLGVKDVVVFVGGVHQRPTDDYTISGTTLTFVGTIASGDSIVIRPQLGLGGSGGGSSAPDYPLFVCNVQTDGSYYYANNYDFAPIKLTTNPAIDTHNGFYDPNNTSVPYTWRVPVGQAGIYLVICKLRLKDGFNAGLSYGIGPSLTNSDNPEFQWTNTNGKREGHINTRIMQLNAGDQVKMIGYFELGVSSVQFLGGSLTIQRIK